MTYVSSVRMRAIGEHFKLTNEELNMPAKEVLKQILKAVVYHKHRNEIEEHIIIMIIITTTTATTTTTYMHILARTMAA